MLKTIIKEVHLVEKLGHFKNQIRHNWDLYLNKCPLVICNYTTRRTRVDVHSHIKNENALLFWAELLKAWLALTIG